MGHSILLAMILLLFSNTISANCELIHSFQTPDPASMRFSCEGRDGFILKTTPVLDFRITAQDKLGGQRVLTFKDLDARDMGYTLSETNLRIKQWLGNSPYLSFEMKFDPSVELYADTRAQKSHGPIGVPRSEVCEEKADFPAKLEEMLVGDKKLIEWSKEGELPLKD